MRRFIKLTSLGNDSFLICNKYIVSVIEFRASDVIPYCRLVKTTDDKNLYVKETIEEIDRKLNQ